MCVRKVRVGVGQIFEMDRGFYNLENDVFESTSYMLQLASKTSLVYVM